MTKHELLSGRTEDLTRWLSETREAVLDHEDQLGAVFNYLLRQFSNEPQPNLKDVIHWRAKIVFYLTEGSDFTESNYDDKHCQLAIELLSPEDLMADSDCLFCLKTFGSKDNLKLHYENCEA